MAAKNALIERLTLAEAADAMCAAGKRWPIASTYVQHVPRSKAMIALCHEMAMPCFDTGLSATIVKLLTIFRSEHSDAHPISYN